jgi:hypothetical protein
MKVTRTNDKVVVQLGAREKGLLWDVLQRYPCLPAAYQPLSKSAQPTQEDPNQKLLNEALAEHRAENKAHLQNFLAERMQVEDQEAGCRMTLTEAEIERLLQLLNDIRVGSWLELGAPEQKEEPPLDARTAPHFWAMEISGYFQMRLLEALAGK